ncbi:MAG: hypothetical protein ACREQZ_00980 [Woeseiaceae bacterium]
MDKKRIALIGYSPGYFQSFAQALEHSGFEVYWVHSLSSAAKYQVRALSTPPARVLDTTEKFIPSLHAIENCKQTLAALESAEGPKINDIILMDRILRRKAHVFALYYLHHLQRVLLKFFTENSIKLVSSGRDTALQMMSMLVCRKEAIPWVVPARLRIPIEMYMFASGHQTASIVNIRAVTNEDRAWAEEFIGSFKAKPSRPALKSAARTFTDVLKMTPRHAKLFVSLLKSSTSDKGNDYSRYTILRILWMYLRRRLNMMCFKAFPPYSSVGERPFCLYALQTQPESSIDVVGSYFSDQIALITFISRSLPVSHELYVKIHPTDVDGKSLWFYRRIAKLPGVRLLNYDVDARDLMERSSIIFTLSGTIGYEAALIGKSVVTFARNYYNRMPTVHHCESPPRLPALVESLLNATPPDNLREQIIDCLADLKAQSFHGEVNRMYLPEGKQLTREDLKSLQAAYDSLYSRLTSPAGWSRA